MPVPQDPDPTGANPPDPFFILKECRELFIRRLTGIVLECGITDTSILDAMSREIGEAHDELASAAPQEGFEQTRGLTASRISLVGNDDLELDIRIGEIVSHLRDDERIDHWRAQLRYMTLLQRPGMTAEESPIGLETIRRGLWAICRASGRLLDQQFELLQRLEDRLREKLSEVYMETNQLLERRGIQPASVQMVRQGGARASSAAQSSSSTPSNALFMLQQAVQQQPGNSLPFQEGLGSGTGGPAARIDHPMFNASTLVMLNHLNERLNSLELQQATAGPAASPQALKAKDLDLPLGQPAAVILDTLSLIFEAIFSSPDLPNAIKTYISRLQIPLLKLAILDPEFFANSQHPARMLVNRMAQAGRGLPQDCGQEHPLCRDISRVADAVRAALENVNADIAPYLAELDALIARRDAAVQAAAAPYIQLLARHENREAARARAQEWLKETLRKTTAPAIASFLSAHWIHAMENACLEGGTGGTAWQEGQAAAAELLWSVQPKQTPDERKQLMALIPALIRKINAGLDRIGVSREERMPFLDACFELQTGVLRGQQSGETISSPSVQPSATRNLTVPSSPSSSSIEENGLLVRYLDPPRPNQPSWRTGKPSAIPGDWLAFTVPDGKRLCGRCCWQGTDSRTLLAFNPAWGYAAAFSPVFLEEQIQAGNARIVSDLSLFDEAAEQALGRLKAG